MENQIANGTIMITWHQFNEQVLYIQPEGGHLQSFWIKVLNKQASFAGHIIVPVPTNKPTNKQEGRNRPNNSRNQIHTLSMGCHFNPSQATD